MVVTDNSEYRVIVCFMVGKGFYFVGHFGGGLIGDSGHKRVNGGASGVVFVVVIRETGGHQ